MPEGEPAPASTEEEAKPAAKAGDGDLNTEEKMQPRAGEAEGCGRQRTDGRHGKAPCIG
jgi:hypothetical protein